MGRWERDMERMNKGTDLVFQNKFEEAEEVYLAGMKENEEAHSGDNDGQVINVAGAVEHDLRGAFALQYALTEVIKGLASLSDDQLDECLKRMWEADRLASEMDAWIGRDVCRGICTACAGLVQILQHNLVKGAWNLMKSWIWIKQLTGDAALNYEGQEREVIRSSALFCVGLFHYLISLLPPSITSTAAWLSGVGGDRVEGMALLWRCWEEEGMLSPWAGESISI